ncbi:PREDICTED: uncharacterized protein LOC109220557 [Nicotiana attenuata]|uniref:uncharacterized protein LOC109220557 n=1 Tax=Nicotiana attenuata TaxID=49451 RepID=UPI00090504C7|nr:PREDICTED: uncharacterized protein LOC109220557 [Nicotiana attenuata]
MAENPDFNYNPRCDKLNIIQMGFADDLLLFCRGDVVSTQLLYKQFQQFSMASGLIANQGKSAVYFGGVPEQIQQQIIRLGFSVGTLPFRYLGVPLGSKRLTIGQCHPILERMVRRVTSWTSKMLSYVGRLQLIRSVLIAIEKFWSQIFILPKKVIQRIEQICKRFLWNGNNECSKKALVAWDKICVPKSAGGLNIVDIYTWIKASILKNYWNLCKKKDRLWIQWIWQQIYKWQGIQRQAMRWKEEIEWAQKHASGNSARAEIYRMSLAGSVYYTWLDRNNKIFQQKTRPATAIVRQIIQDIHCKGRMRKKLAPLLKQLDYYPS